MNINLLKQSEGLKEKASILAISQIMSREELDKIKEEINENITICKSFQKSLKEVLAEEKIHLTITSLIFGIIFFVAGFLMASLTPLNIPGYIFSGVGLALIVTAVCNLVKFFKFKKEINKSQKIVSKNMETLMDLLNQCNKAIEISYGYEEQVSRTIKIAEEARKTLNQTPGQMVRTIQSAQGAHKGKAAGSNPARGTNSYH